MTRTLITIATLWTAGAAHGEWRYWSGDQGATYHSGDKGDRGRTTIECTPIVIGAVMYVTSPMLKTMALDAATGKEIWRFDPFEGTDERPRDVNRGVAYWEDAKKADQRILYAVGKSLYCLNARTGKLN